MPTFYERFQQSARQFPSKIALEIQRQDRIESVTFAELQTMAESVGSWLAGKVDRDARVAILAANHPRWVAAYLGIICSGRVAVPLDTAFHADQVAKLLKDSGASILFCDAKHLAVAQQAAEGLPVSLVMTSAAGEQVASHPTSGGGMKPLADLDSIFAAASGGFEPVVPTESDLAALLYTSGTTADPKGVMLTHRNVYLHAMNLAVHHHNRYDDVMMHTIPLFHANGWGAAHTITLVGGTHVMLPRFVPEEIFRLVEKERVSALSLVPIMATALVNCPARSKYNLGSVQWCVIGGAASSPTLIREVEQTLGFNCYSGYGLTETSPSLANAQLKPDQECTPEERHALQAMTGYAYPGSELRVVDADDIDVAHDGVTMGEIIARSDGVMAGYWQEPEATAEALRGGWFRTGDRAVIEENGCIRIVDRKKDIIVSGGENISSIDVEKVLLSHPDVYEAAVIPVPDQKWGEIPKAVVVVKPGRNVNEAGLIEFCRSRLAHYKCPQSIEFCESLPKTATGKVLKRELRKKYQPGAVTLPSDAL